MATLALNTSTDRTGQSTRGSKFYELSNHLGNVLATVSDMKLGYVTSLGQTTAEGYKAQVQSASDYYPFGWAMSGRQYSAGEYRFGFNGKENDTHWGDQLIQDYGFRLYNPAIAKFLSVDPLAPEYPMLTTYQFASNSPIAAIDVEGLEGAVVINTYDDGGLVQTRIFTARDASGLVNLQASGNGIGNLQITDVLEVNRGVLPEGVTNINVRSNALPAGLSDDERAILGAGVDASRVLSNVTQDLNNTQVTLTGLAEGITFPGSVPQQNNPVTVNFYSGTYSDVPTPRRTPVRGRSIGFSFVEPVSGSAPGAYWIETGGRTLRNTTDIVSAVRTQVNALESAGIDVSGIAISRGLDSPQAIARQQNSGVRSQIISQRNTLFGRTQSALQAAFPRMRITLSTPTNLGAPNITVSGNRTTTTTVPTVVGSSRELTTP